MNYSFMYRDLNSGLKFCYSGHGLNNGIVKVHNLNGSVIQMSGIQIPTVQELNATQIHIDQSKKKWKRGRL